MPTSDFAVASTTTKLVGKVEFESTHPVERDLQSPAPLQLRRLPLNFILVSNEGFEPPPYAPKAYTLPDYASPSYKRTLKQFLLGNR